MSKPNADDHMDVDPHIEKRFELVKLVGKGAYGIVWRAIDRKTRQVVALKKVFDGFSNQTDAQRTYREVMFLQRLHHDNIVRLLGVHKAENHTDLYLVFEFIDTDLYHTIRSNLLQEIHKKFVTYQLLRCVRYLHKRGLIHRDLKPANVLLNSDCHAKLGDFGLARSLVQLERDGPKQVLTDYIATRWYRPPEIVTGSTYYSRGVDMWGIGCVIGEMLTGKPLLPGSSTNNQMERIVAMCGQPTAEDVKSLRSGFAEEMLRSIKRVEPRPLKAALAMYDKQAVDLMTKLLVFNPDKRISAAEAMCHPYVAQFATPEELVPDDGPVTDPILLPVPDADRLEISDYREALYREMTKQKRDARDKKLSKGAGGPAGRSSASSTQPDSNARGQSAAENKVHEEAAPGSGKDGVMIGNTLKNASNSTPIGVSAGKSLTGNTNNNKTIGGKSTPTSMSTTTTTANVNSSTGPLGAVINKTNARAPTPVEQHNNNNNNNIDSLHQQQNTTNSNNNTNMINGSVFKGNNLMTTKALKKRTPLTNTTSAGLGAPLHDHQFSTVANPAFPVVRQMASTPAPTSNTTTTSMLLFNHQQNTNNGNNTMTGAKSTIPPSRQPLGALRAGNWPSQQNNNNSNNNISSTTTNNNYNNNNQQGHQYFSTAATTSSGSNINNNAFSTIGGGGGNARKPLPSELMYAGRSTPQPNGSNTTTTTSAGIFGYRSVNNNNQNIINHTTSTSSYASPLVAQFPNSNNKQLNNNNPSGLQMTVKPTTTIFSQNTTSATSWNNNNTNNHTHSNASLAPLNSNSNNNNQSSYSAYNNNNNNNNNNQNINTNSVYSKPSALGAGSGKFGNLAGGPPRATSKLRQMVQDAQSNNK